ncbi:replication initiation protein [Rheinheimera phage Barba21A]|uniref:Uncharacterized protein n=1 Tax=Rheinheimera phage Barba21A TaxID=2849598 RepID=A0A4V1F038_9CAUD|nr:replication initiation protein [Rheinheimera phage Barba21A]QCQ62345.1 hypothetical protein Barba21A_gp085 [Rheinheimera phage Barba21A]
MIKNTFTKIGDHLLMCGAVVSPDGEVIKVTAADKLILTFMHHRWNYFVVEEKQEYWDSMEYIALRTGNNVKTVERCVSKFTKAGILLAEKRFDKKKKHNKWFWLGFSEVKYMVTKKDGGMEFVKEGMEAYKPKPHYKEDNTAAKPALEDFDMLVPYSDYDHDVTMSMWEAGL